MSNKKQGNGHQGRLVNCPAPDRRELTIYSSGFGVIQESRRLELGQGHNQVQLDGMPAQAQPTSLLFLTVTGEGNLTFGAVSYRPANLNQSGLLSRSVGSQITVRLRSAGKQSTVSGKLLAYAGNKLVVEVSPNRTWIGDANENVELSKLPEGLSNSAALVVDVEATLEGVYDARILYQALGLSWAAYHKAIYDDNKGELSRLEAWVSVTNGSGTSFDQATLKLLAGNVRAGHGREGMVYALAAAAPPRGGAAKGAGIRQAAFENVGEQKLYVVSGKVSLADGENKQVPLFSAAGVKVGREYYLEYADAGDGGADSDSLEPVSIRLHVVNSEEAHLGKPIPAGQVSIYQSDSSGSPQLTGTASVDHVAAGEKFDLSIGAATDIKASCRLVEASQDEPEPPRTVHPLGAVAVSRPRNPQQAAADAEETEEKPLFRTETREVTVHNFKGDREVAVNVYDNFPEGHELKVETGQSFEKKTATRHCARMTVAAGSKTQIRYTLRYRIN